MYVIEHHPRVNIKRILQKFEQLNLKIIFSKIDQFLVSSRAIFVERRNHENCRLDVDRAKNILQKSATLEQRNESSRILQLVENVFRNQSELLISMLMNIKDLADNQIGAWRSYIEARRDFMICGSSKSNELINNLFTDAADLTYTPSEPVTHPMLALTSKLYHSNYFRVYFAL